MANPDDIASLQRKQTADALTGLVLPKLPEVPDDVKKRFPSMRQFEADLEEWRVKANIVIRGGQA